MPSMITTIETKNIPSDQFDAIARPHRDAGATVERVDQGGGLVTMRATYPRPVDILTDDDLVD